MNPPPVNLNLRRRLLPGLLALAAAPALRLLLRPLRRKPGRDAPLWVFSSYMVGDLFMALPALKRLAEATDVRVICRSDCAEILRREGLQPIPFDNAFFTRRTPSAFLRTLRAAWRLRGLPKSIALDLDADPRTALWLRIAGAARAVSYRRPFGVLFDETFALPPGAVHQADRDRAVVEEFLRGHGVEDSGRRTADNGETRAPSTLSARESNAAENMAHAEAASNFQFPQESSHALPSTVHRPLSTPWLLSVWTRKPAKNWPLRRWEEFMERLREEGVPFAVLNAPDGDAAFQRFRDRWRGRAEFAEGSLEAIAARVRESAGAVATDNFLGHMAGYYGKPVLWINIVSPADQVAPRGPRTVRVQADAQAEGPPRAGDLSPDAVWKAFAELRSAKP